MKPAGHPDCGACPHQSEPARCLEEISGCLEAISGEQGPTAEEIENAKLRRELAEIAEAFRASERYREDAHSRLAGIVDEAFGPQEVLSLPALLSRLEHLLTERALQHEEVRRELEKSREKVAKLRRERDEHEARWGAEVGNANNWHANNWCAKSRVAEAQRDDALWWCAQATQSEREHRETLIRCRTAAQILIAEIGATGPENIEETARRAGAVIRLERGQKRADLLQDLAEVTVALRNLIASVEATKTCNTIVLRDLEAARAVLGGQS